MYENIILNPSGNALTRQVKRAKHLVAKEKAKQCAKCIGQSGIVTGIGALACKALGMEPAAWPLFSGALIGSILHLENPKLIDAIQHSKALQAKSEYKEIVSRAKKIYNL